MCKVVWFCVFSLFFVSVSQSKRALQTFLKVCHRHDPLITECLKAAIETIKPYLGKGIPEMRIVPLDPLRITQLVLDDGNVRFQYDDLDLYKLDQFEVVEAHLDYDKCNADLSFRIPLILAEARYKVNGRLLVFNLEGEGKVYVNFTDVLISGKANCTRKIMNNQEFAVFEKIDFKLKIGDYHLHLTDLFKNNPELTERTNAVFNENSQNLIPEFEPLVRAGIEKIVLSSLQNVFERFSLEELLPE